MKRWMWFVIAGCLSTAIYFTIRYGLRPKAIPVMGVKSFNNLNEIGGEAYHLLRQSIRSERLILLGSDPDVASEREIWLGWRQSAEKDGEIIVDIDGSSLDEALLRQNLSAGHLIVVHGATTQASHFVSGSLAHRLEQIVQHPVLSISTLRLPIKPQDQDDLSSQCLNPREDAKSGEGRLQCAALRVGRRYQRRNLDPSRIWAAIERDGLKEYLIFVHSQQ